MSNGPVYIDWGKLAQIVIIIIATVVLGVLEVIDKSAVTLTIGAASGYIFGNGKSVKAGHPQAPLIGLRPADDKTWTLEDQKPPRPDGRIG